MRLTLLTALSVLAAASPAPNGYGFCATVRKQVGYNGQQSSVSAYCSSYLSIPVYTKTAKKSLTTIVTETEAGPTWPQQTKTVTIQTGRVYYFTTNQYDTDAVISFKSLTEDKVPTKFELTGAGILREANFHTLLVGTSTDEPPHLKYVEDGSEGEDFTCSIQIRDDYMCQLNCERAGVRQVNYICGEQAWKIGTGSVVPDGCVAFTPLVTPSADQQK